MHARKMSRHKKLTMLTAGAVVLLVGVAVALLLLRAPITGSGNITTDANVEFTAVSVVSQTGTINCAATLEPDRSVTLNVNNAVAGSNCVVKFSIRSTGADVGPLRLQDVRYAAPTTEAFMPGGCGAVVTPAGISVDVKVSVPTGAATGPFTAQADAGLFATDTFDPATCPTAA